MHRGKIDVAVGPMFSGKSAWLIERLNAHAKNGDKILAVRYSGDNRYSDYAIASHNGSTFNAKSAQNVSDIASLLTHTSFTIFGIDEIQFFERSLVPLLQQLKKKQIHVYAAGLDFDFLFCPWETTRDVLSLADTVQTFTAQCSVCKKETATKTQRLINGKPANADSPRILIGDTDVYEPRCDEHYTLIG